MGLVPHARYASGIVYPLIKHLHLAAVALSLGGFLLRIWWRWRSPARLLHPLARTLPHVNDTVLLGAGITLAWSAGWSPLTDSWLAVKIAALVIYVLLGATALRGRDAAVRAGAFVGAVFVFLYIASVAVTKQPCWWLGGH